jgi:hypothetical protein
VAIDDGVIEFVGTNPRSLDADPLVNIANTTRIHAVIRAGRYLDRAALARLTPKGPYR